MKKLNVVRAVGKLRHQWFAEYSAVIVLAFFDSASARDARRALGAPWKCGSTSRKALVASLDRAALNVELDRLERFGADRKKVMSVARSIDEGEAFEVEIPVIPGEQCALFEGWAP